MHDPNRLADTKLLTSLVSEGGSVTTVLIPTTTVLIHQTTLFQNEYIYIHMSRLYFPVSLKNSHIAVDSCLD